MDQKINFSDFITTYKEPIKEEKITKVEIEKGTSQLTKPEETKPNLEVKQDLIKTESKVLIENFKEKPLQTCKSCKCAFDKSFFKGSKGHYLKTCLDCRNKSTIKKPSEILNIFDNVPQEELIKKPKISKSDQQDKIKKEILENVEQMAKNEVFNRAEIVQKIKPYCQKSQNLDIMTDEQIKTLRDKIVKKQIDKFSNIPETLFDISTIGIEVLENLTTLYLPNFLSLKNEFKAKFSILLKTFG